jgi:hypothetical protein
VSKNSADCNTQKLLNHIQPSTIKTLHIYCQGHDTSSCSHIAAHFSPLLQYIDIYEAQPASHRYLFSNKKMKIEYINDNLDTSDKLHGNVILNTFPNSSIHCFWSQQHYVPNNRLHKQNLKSGSYQQLKNIHTLQLTVQPF